MVREISSSSVPMVTTAIGATMRTMELLLLHSSPMQGVGTVVLGVGCVEETVVGTEHGTSGSGSQVGREAFGGVKSARV